MSKEELELGKEFMPKFDDSGLIPVIAQDYHTNKVLMLAYMNKEALEKTIETKKAYYYSRSRKSLWLKGETSGQIQTVRELRTDCDQDAVLILVEVGGDGGCCHVGYENCFYRVMDNEDHLVIDGKKA